MPPKHRDASPEREERELERHNIPLAYRSEIEAALRDTGPAGNVQRRTSRFANGMVVTVEDGRIASTVWPPSDSEESEGEDVQYYVCEISPNCYGAQIGDRYLECAEELVVTRSEDAAHDYAADYMRDRRRRQHGSPRGRRHCSLDEESVEIYRCDGTDTERVERLSYECYHDASIDDFSE